MPAKQQPPKPERDDHVSKPMGFMVGWGIPILALISLNVFRPSAAVATAVVMVAFVWMGAACISNAKRCGRRHCIYSGPIFLIGAVATGLVGYGVVDIGSNGLVITTWVTFMAVALTFIPELIWGKYKD